MPHFLNLKNLWYFKLCSLPLHFMNFFKAHIGIILTIVVLAASLLPTLHAFDHEKSSEDNFGLTEKVSDASFDCDLCDFHIMNAEAPSAFDYDFSIPLKETVYSISLAETVNISAKPLFSLRAPPAVIS